MKFIASSSALLKKLTQLNGVVSSNAVIPILEYFLFEIEAGVLTITSTDLEISMRSSIAVESREEGKIAVPGKLIIDFLKMLPEQPITFSINPEDNQIELKTEKGQYKITGENPSDFPKLPEVENATRIDMSAAAINSAIASTVFAISSNELRPAMTGLFFEIEGGEARWVATDGNKLSRYIRRDIDVETDASFIVPKKAVSILKTVLPSEDISVNMQFNSHNVRFGFQDFTVICRLIDERFPDYKAAIPKEHPFQLTVNRNELIGSLRRMSNFSNKTTYQVKFKIAGNDLNISAQDIDFSNEAHERLNCEFDGEDMEIGFNARFLTEMLNVIDTENALILLSSFNRPGIIKPTDESQTEDLLMLLMPIVINTGS